MYRLDTKIRFIFVSSSQVSTVACTSVVGTGAYLSPEAGSWKRQAPKILPRSDQWALSSAHIKASSQKALVSSYYSAYFLPILYSGGKLLPLLHTINICAYSIDNCCALLLFMLHMCCCIYSICTEALLNKLGFTQPFVLL